VRFLALGDALPQPVIDRGFPRDFPFHVVGIRRAGSGGRQWYAETLEGLFAEIAEVANGIKRAFLFSSLLDLKLDLAHWLFDYTLKLAWVLVGLGDVKSMKYGSRWVGRVEKYAERLENDGMRKVFIALRDAWRRETKDPDHVENSGSDKHCGSPGA